MYILCIYVQEKKNENDIAQAANPNMLFLQVVLWGLKPSSNDRSRCVDIAIWRDFTMGVRKGGLMVETR